jgi:hypothetical protein
MENSGISPCTFLKAGRNLVHNFLHQKMILYLAGDQTPPGHIALLGIGEKTFGLPAELLGLGQGRPDALLAEQREKEASKEGPPGIPGTA